MDILHIILFTFQNNKFTINSEVEEFWNYQNLTIYNKKQIKNCEKHPLEPLTTSSLQQQTNNNYNYSPKEICQYVQNYMKMV